MSFQELVSSFSNGLGTLLKIAQDLAKILDHPATQLTKEAWSGSDRRKVHEIFCAIFLRAGLPLPEFEETLWRVDLPKDYGDSKRSADIARRSASRIKAHVRGAKSASAKKIRALAETILLFPEPNGGIRRENIIAMVNKLLVDEMGAQPLRPEYESIDIPAPIHVGPSRLVRVVIIDDDQREIIKTALKIAGIPNVETEIVHYASVSRWGSLSGEKLDARLEEISQQILSLHPDIVLMDQGLGDIDGDQLVKCLRYLAETENGSSPIFIANSGGGGEELAAVGCHSNFEKGGSPRGFLSVLNSL